MTNNRIIRKANRSPAQEAELAKVREEFQAGKPSLEELLESGEYEAPVSQRVYLATQMIAQRLKEAREQAGLSLADVAAMTGIDRSAISRVENGTHANPTVNTLSRLASVYHLQLTLGPEEEIAAS